MSDITHATADFERWLSAHVPVVRADLEHKHERMARSSFAFFRATYYRFVQRWASLAGDAAGAPRVLAVGDLHVENFGTWRDVEGRLCWGVDDFDEAAQLPYTLDLARLAASALLAGEGGDLRVKPGLVAEAVLEGYDGGLRGGPAPFVLEEHASWLREAALAAMPDGRTFWADLEGLGAPARTSVARQARRVLERSLPPRAESVRTVARRAGLGSLGQPRWVCLAMLAGAPVAREAKLLRPPATCWSGGRGGPVLAARLAAGASRSHDPSLAFERGWVVRRRSPEVARVALRAMAGAAGAERLLAAMGRELANVHHATPRALDRVRRDLASRRGRWLADLARRVADATAVDARAWAEAFDVAARGRRRLAARYPSAKARTRGQ